jgi:hypothetical protein
LPASRLLSLPVVSPSFAVVETFGRFSLQWALALVLNVDAFQGYRYRDILEDYQKEAKENDFLPSKNKATTADDVQELYLTQRLDHFDPTNLQTCQTLLCHRSLSGQGCGYHQPPLPSRVSVEKVLALISLF